MRERCAARYEGVPALVQDRGTLRDLGSTCRPQASRRNPDELRVGHLRETAVIAQNRKIRASGDILGTFLFLDLVRGNAHHMIVLQRKLHGLVKSDASGRRGFDVLSGDRRAVDEREQKAQKRGAAVHDFVACVDADSPPTKPSSP